MRFSILFALFCAAGFAQPIKTVPPASIHEACVGTPGNTAGAYRQQCQTSAGALYTCNNTSGCSTAGQWVAQGGGSGTINTGTGLAYYPSSGTTISGISDFTFSGHAISGGASATLGVGGAAKTDARIYVEGDAFTTYDLFRAKDTHPGGGHEFVWGPGANGQAGFFWYDMTSGALRGGWGNDGAFVFINDAGFSRTAAAHIAFGNGTAGDTSATVQLTTLWQTAIAFASLGTTNGMVEYCSNCKVTSSIDNTCVDSGSGALAVRINGVSKCLQ